MYNVTESFGTQIDTLSSSYQTCSGAYALFYWGAGSTTGLRVEANFLAKEFVDNVAFGHDPEGLLFYDAPSDFNVSGDTPYKVYKNNQSPPAIRVDFFNPNETTLRYASFITRDTNGISATQLARYTHDGKGKWSDHKVATSQGQLYKQMKSKTVLLTLKPIGKKITWTIDDTTHALDITGTFTYGGKSTIVAGTKATANYDEDRVLIHNGNTQVGVFYASQAIPFSNSTAATEPNATIADISDT